MPSQFVAVWRLRVVLDYCKRRPYLRPCVMATPLMPGTGGGGVLDRIYPWGARL